MMDARCAWQYPVFMTDVTQILSAIEQGDPTAAEQLLPLVYNELRQLAAAKLARENPRQTLQATALVHEAYLRLVEGTRPQDWNSRGHFFSAAAEAMRRILVENARQKQSAKGGGKWHRINLVVAADQSDEEPQLDLLCLDEALHRLEEHDAHAASLVQLRFFAGLTMEEAAAALNVSTRSAYYTWTYARSWLRKQMQAGA